MLLNGEAQIEEIPLPFSNMCSTQADKYSRKWRLRCGCQFPWCALALRDIQKQSLTARLEKGKEVLPNYNEIKKNYDKTKDETDDHL
jgi:hypothetical protein